MTKQQLAHQWIAAWNNHDLAAIMGCYAESIEHTSPKIAAYFNMADSTLRNKALLESYFKQALQKNPTLHFDLQHVLEGHNSVVLIYKRMNTALAGEYLEFGETGLIVRSRSHYKLI
ncbi:MAG: nuclear transport factor 2 family protein [Chitinophagales bacterium]